MATDTDNSAVRMRTERDSMGEIQVPGNAYYGAQTQRAVENFPISGWQLPPTMIHAMGRVKYACGVANRDLGKLTGTGKNPLSDEQVAAMLAAAQDVVNGELDNQFPIDVFQTGSGTSSNMNINEVISNRAIEQSWRRSDGRGETDPPKRSRQYGAKHQRYFSHGNSRRSRNRIKIEPDSGTSPVGCRRYMRKPKPGTR